MQRTKDQARQHLFIQAMLRLNESSEGQSFPMSKLFAPVDSDATAIAQSNTRRWQRASMERVEKLGIVRSYKQRSTLFYQVADSATLSQLVSQSRDHNDQGAITHILFPEDYARPKWLGKHSPEKPGTELAVVDDDPALEAPKEKSELESEFSKIYFAISEGTEEERWEAMSKILANLLLESRETFESTQRTEETLKSFSDNDVEDPMMDELLKTQEAIAAKLNSNSKRLDNMEQKVGMTNERVGILHKRIPLLTENLELAVKALNMLGPTLENLASAMKATADKADRIVSIVAFNEKLHAIKAEVQTWVKVLGPMANSSSDSLAGIEAIMESLGRMEESNGSGENS